MNAYVFAAGIVVGLVSFFLIFDGIKDRVLAKLIIGVICMVIALFLIAKSQYLQEKIFEAQNRAGLIGIQSTNFVSQ